MKPRVISINKIWFPGEETGYASKSRILYKDDRGRIKSMVVDGHISPGRAQALIEGEAHA